MHVIGKAIFIAGKYIFFYLQEIKKFDFFSISPQAIQTDNIESSYSDDQSQFKSQGGLYLLFKS